MMSRALRGYLEYLVTAFGGVVLVGAAALVNQKMRHATEANSLVALIGMVLVGVALTYTFATVKRHRAAVRAIIRRDAANMELSALSGVRLLLVDDQEDELNVLAEALEARGAHVEKANTIERAIRQLETESPHLVLSDLAMPDDVARLMARVKLSVNSNEKPLAAIALSKYVTSFGKERIVELGFNAFLSKPILLEALVEEIQRQLAPPNPSDDTTRTRNARQSAG